MATNPPTKTKMTADDYFALPETMRRQELIHGELITYGDDGMAPAPKDVHEETTMLLVAFLMQHLPARELRTAPTDVYFDKVNVVQPDVFWISAETGQCQRHDDGYLHGAPDFVIEILSPGTEKQDKSTKYDLYEQHGVREYWIVDNATRLVEVYARLGEKFSRHGVFGTGESFKSPVLGDKVVDVDAILG